MGEIPEYYPDQVGIVDNDGSLVIAFNIPKQQLVIDFQVGKSFDEQDKKLGMGTIYVGRTDLGIGHYNGIKTLELERDNTLVVELLCDVAKGLMIANAFTLPFGHLQNSTDIESSISHLLASAPLIK